MRWGLRQTMVVIRAPIHLSRMLERFSEIDSHLIEDTSIVRRDIMSIEKETFLHFHEVSANPRRLP